MAKTFSFSHAILKDLKRRKMDYCFKNMRFSETRDMKKKTIVSIVFIFINHSILN